MSEQWSNVNANFYLDNFGTEELTIYPLGKTRIKLEVVPEEIEVTTSEGEAAKTPRRMAEKNKDIRKMKRSQIKSATLNEEASRTCQDCGKVLASAASLYVHLKSHSTNKPYICSECGANFTRKYYLEVHQRTHTGERPFKCDICEKYFSQKSSLNTHRRKHTGEKPYQCSLCDKAFSAQSYLVSHQWTHYEKVDGVFTCTDCNVAFENRTHFAEHTRTHVKDLRFQCEYCPRRFSKECHLIRHKNGVHLRAMEIDDY